VIRCFIGTGESFSRIHDKGARRLTLYLWEKLHGRPLPLLEVSKAEILESHLDPYDVEDLVYVWLQVARGYIALPRSRNRDTPAYEYTMIHRTSGRRAIAQVKTGSTPLDLAALALAPAGQATDTFAYATSGSYIGDPADVTEVIATDELLRFAGEHEALLPPRVRAWLQLAGE
jgi:hypothetical protein